MRALIKKLIHDCLTENDGVSYCPFRLGGAALSVTGIPTFIGCAIYSTVTSGRFDYVGFGTSFGMIMTGMAGLAAGVAIKARTDTAAQPTQ